jgi:SAM-dependent methyltransferase
MSDEDKSKVITFYNRAAWNYSDRYDRGRLLEATKYPANYFRLQLLLTRMSNLGCKRAYEVGTGEGTPLMSLVDMGVDVYGCDIAEAMVKATRDRLKTAGLDEERCILADIEDSLTIAPHLSVAPFDTVIAFGVIPHVRKDEVALGNMRSFLRPGGRLFLEFRNKLFSLFTFNEHTKQFVLNDLLSGVSAGVKDAVAAELAWRCADSADEAGSAVAAGENEYAAILAKFHNPFELAPLLERCGFRKIKIHWYHYHPAMPRLEERLGPAFRTEAISLEHDSADWRGNFLCSAGVVEAVAV